MSGLSAASAGLRLSSLLPLQLSDTLPLSLSGGRTPQPQPRRVAPSATGYVSAPQTHFALLHDTVAASAIDDGPPVKLWPPSRDRLRTLVRNILMWDTLVAFLPVAAWMLLFQGFQFTPVSWRPSITVGGLAWFEDVVLGGQLHRYVPGVHGTVFWDVFAALAYFIHFAAPWTFMLYLSQTNGRHLSFVWCLGWLNIIAVATQIVFPTAPPWYLAKYGFREANYGVHGDPGGLAYADRLLGFPFFYSIYWGSPIVFGSFPSLHAAWPVLIAVHAPFGSVVAKFMWAYSIVVWWAAMYLQHHYLIDLIAGAAYVYVAIHVASFMLHVVERLAPAHAPLFLNYLPPSPLVLGGGSARAELAALPRRATSLPFVGQLV